jgi:hypothetical protein
MSPPNGVYEWCMGLTEPLLAAVVATAHKLESVLQAVFLYPPYYSQASLR